MTKRKINVIKGFVVPPGYSLRITEDDGNVLEKLPGEKSGGTYSFEQVAQGIDPDWELTQESQPQIQQSHPSSQQVTPNTSEKTPVGSTETPSSSPEEILSRVSQSVSSLVSKYAPMPKQKASHVLDAMYEWDSLQPEIKETVSFDDFLGDFLDKAFGEEVVELGARSTRVVDLPPRTDVESIRNIANTIKGGASIRNYFEKVLSSEAGKLVIKKIDALYTQEAKVVQDRNNLLEEARVLEKDIASGKYGMGTLLVKLTDMNNLHGRVTELGVRISEIRGALQNEKDRFFNNNFRLAITGNTDVIDYLESTPTATASITKREMTPEQAHGVTFAMNFVHPSIRTKVKIDIKSNLDRSYLSPTTGILNMEGKGSSAIFAHETGHVIEGKVLDSMVIPFLYKRVGASGETAIPMKKINKAYKADEFSLKDDFMEPYTGKVYTNVNSGGPGFTLRDYPNIIATEIVSMGLEHMYKDPIVFAQKDPEFFDFIWSLRSNPKVRKAKDGNR